MKAILIIGYNAKRVELKIAHEKAEADANIVAIKKDFDQFSMYELDTTSLELMRATPTDGAVRRVQQMAELGEQLTALVYNVMDTKGEQ